MLYCAVCRKGSSSRIRAALLSVSQIFFTHEWLPKRNKNSIAWTWRKEQGHFSIILLDPASTCNGLWYLIRASIFDCMDTNVLYPLHCSMSFGNRNWLFYHPAWVQEVILSQRLIAVRDSARLDLLRFTMLMSDHWQDSPRNSLLEVLLANSYYNSWSMATSHLLMFSEENCSIDVGWGALPTFVCCQSR